jgi:hypothetical protein
MEEGEELLLDAAHMKTQLETKLREIGKTTAMIDYIGGDNATVNKKFASDMNVPFVGCASHRLNLAVKLLTDDDGNFAALIGKVNEFMKVLKTLPST